MSKRINNEMHLVNCNWAKNIYRWNLFINKDNKFSGRVHILEYMNLWGYVSRDTSPDDGKGISWHLA